MIHPQWRLNHLPTEDYDDINGPQEIYTEDTPRQRLLKKITNDLYSHHTNVGSIMTRIEDVLDTPFVQMAEPEVVTKKKEEDQLVQKTSPGQSPGISLLLNMQRVANAQTVVRLDITKGHVRSIIKI